MIRCTANLVLAAAILAGCHAPPRQSAPDAAQGAHEHGYALLYSTISDEARLDGILIVKRPSAPVAQLVKDIAHFATESKAALQKTAASDPTISLTDTGLPQAEARTREAISSATSKQLLSSSGPELDLRLLLTQHEALNYIQHMAGVTAKDEHRDDRKRLLEDMGQYAATLQERVLQGLRASQAPR